MSSFINFVTSLSSTTASRAQPLWALVISWRIAVRKPCGLKNPVSQKTFGRPSNNQLVNCACRSSRSVNQNPIVADSHEIYQMPKSNINYKILQFQRFSVTHNHSVAVTRINVIQKLWEISAAKCVCGAPDRHADLILDKHKFNPFNHSCS